MEPADSPNFETSLAELQQIVAKLEDGSVGLDASLAEFERGVKLLRTCYQILENAEQKIELLVGLNEQGVPVTQPFDATATFDAKEQTVGRRRSTKKPAHKPSAEGQPNDLSDDGALF
jgi:exodeoxyribonuclease VII small subunit